MPKNRHDFTPTPTVCQADAFNELMSMIWEGGLAYDIYLEPDSLPIHNACHLASKLFPKTWKGRQYHEDGENLTLIWPDKSRAVLALDGGSLSVSGE